MFCQPLTVRELLIVSPTDRRKLLANILVEIYQVADQPFNEKQFGPIREAFLTVLIFVVTEK